MHCFYTIYSGENKIKAIDKEIVSKLISKQRENLEKEVKQLKKIGYSKGKAAAIFNLKDKITGKKKTGQEAMTMKHPRTKVLLSKRNEIKEAALLRVFGLLDQVHVFFHLHYKYFHRISFEEPD